MGRSEAGLTAACTVIQDLKRWQGSGVWLLALWQPQSWPQELLQINQLRMLILQSLNLSSKKVTFRSLNKLGNKEKLSQERLYSKEVLKEKINQRVRKKGKVKEEIQNGRREGKGKEKIEPVKERNQKARKEEMEKEEKKEGGQEKINQEEQRNQRKINKEMGQE